MSEILVHRGPAVTYPQAVGNLVDPIWIRMIRMSGRVVSACRFDVLARAPDRLEQFHFTCAAMKPPQPAQVGGFYLPEPKADNIHSVSVQVERAELVKKLRALADTIENLADE